MKRVLYTLLALMMVLGVSLAQADQRIVVTENNNHQKYVLHVGEQLDILLRYNAGTAFVWVSGDSSCGNPGSVTIEAENSVPIGPMMPGSPYFAHYVVSAIKSGKTCVDFILKNYSAHGAAAKTFGITVEVVD